VWVFMDNLGGLTRAVQEIANNTRSPFGRMDERSRHTDTMKIQQEQTEILRKQQEFNTVLALATTVLAIGVFIELIITLLNEGLNFSEIVKIHWGFGMLLIFGIMFFFTFMGGIIFLLLKILFFRKKKKVIQ